MVLTMASQDVQNFFQPFSSWLSRVYEALQQAGDALSASLVLLSKHDSALSEKPEQDLDAIQIQETYLEDEEQEDHDGSSEEASSLFLEEDHFSCSKSDWQDPVQMASPTFGQQAKDSSSVIPQWPSKIPVTQKPQHVLSSIAEEEQHSERQRCGRQLPGTLEKVNGRKQGKLVCTIVSVLL